MSVLDPFEVFDIEVWPMPELQATPGKDREARLRLDALERLITQQAVDGSQFMAILNEKDPPLGPLVVERPPSLRGRIVSERVHALRSHPDFRIARRSLIISRLAQVISERKVQGGLRRVLLTKPSDCSGSRSGVTRGSAGPHPCRSRPRRRSKRRGGMHVVLIAEGSARRSPDCHWRSGRSRLQ